jgi:hypothetical protein
MFGMRRINLMLLGFLLLEVAPGYAADVAIGQTLRGEVLVEAKMTDTPFLEISLGEIDDSLWSLSPFSPSRKDIHFLVRASRPWKFIVADTDPQTMGRLTEWDGRGYTITQLSSPLTIVGSRRVVLPNLENAPVQSGGPTGPQGLDIKISLEQYVSDTDSPIPSESIYLIKMNFTLAAD